MASEGDLSQEKSVGLSKIISYGFTSVIDSLIIIMYQQTVFYFYEVEIGLNVALVGFAYVIFAIWNMINDPLVGFLTDKPRKWSRKIGVRKPWILIGCILTMVFFFLLFTPPDIDPKAYPLIIFLYMVIMTCLFDLFYSLYTTHFQGGFVNYFRDPSDRRKASALHRVIGNIGRFIGAVFIIPFTVVYGDKNSFVRAAFFAVVVMVVCLILILPGIKESDELKENYIRSYEEAEQISFFEMLKYALKSKNFMIYLLSFTLFTLAYSLYQANFIYFLKDALNLPMTFQTYVAALFFLGILLGMVPWVLFAKKMGSKKVYVISLSTTGVVWLFFSMITTPVQFFICAISLGLSMSGFLAMIMVILSDSFDEITLKCGRHQEATLLGITNFFLRVSYLAVGAIITIVHILTAYNPDPTATQTATAVWGVRILAGFFPGIFCIVGAIVFLIFYDLKGEKKLKMVAELRLKGL